MSRKSKEKYRVILEVEKIEGNCPVYEVGDKITLEDPEIVMSETDAVCMHAFNCMMTLLLPLCRGIEPSEIGLSKEGDDVGHIQCPDPGKEYTGGGTVLFRIKRELLG